MDVNVHKLCRRQVKLRPKAEARDKEAWCPWLSLRQCCIWIPQTMLRLRLKIKESCTWVKEKVSSKFELRQGLKLFTNSGYRATL